MNIGLKQISVCLMVMVAMTDALANPGGNRWDGVMRAIQIQPVPVDRGDQRNDPRIAGPNERRRDGFGRQDTTSGYGNNGDNPANNGNDNARRQGRMSPEERRALRRQIDEAGHDIYRPKR